MQILKLLTKGNAFCRFFKQFISCGKRFVTNRPVAPAFGKESTCHNLPR